MSNSDDVNARLSPVAVSSLELESESSSENDMCVVSNDIESERFRILVYETLRLVLLEAIDCGAGCEISHL